MMKTADIYCLIRECRRIIELVGQDIEDLYEEYDERIRFDDNSAEAEEELEAIRDHFERSKDLAAEASDEIMFAMCALGLPDWKPSDFWERVRAEKEGNDK